MQPQIVRVSLHYITGGLNTLKTWDNFKLRRRRQKNGIENRENFSENRQCKRGFRGSSM